MEEKWKRRLWGVYWIIVMGLWILNGTFAIVQNDIGFFVISFLVVTLGGIGFGLWLSKKGVIENEL